MARLNPAIKQSGSFLLLPGFDFPSGSLGHAFDVFGADFNFGEHLQISLCFLKGVPLAGPGHHPSCAGRETGMTDIQHLIGRNATGSTVRTNKDGT